MMYVAIFILGLIVGFLNSLLAVVLIFRYQKPLERLSKMTVNTFKAKGSVLDAEEETISNWIAELPDGN